MSHYELGNMASEKMLFVKKPMKIEDIIPT